MIQSLLIGVFAGLVVSSGGLLRRWLAAGPGALPIAVGLGVLALAALQWSYRRSGGTRDALSPDLREPERYDGLADLLMHVQLAGRRDGAGGWFVQGLSSFLLFGFGGDDRLWQFDDTPGGLHRA